MSRHKVNDPKTIQADKTRAAFYTLTLDWIYLNRYLPRPAVVNNQNRRANRREYGHPAEWASDKAARIADLFWSWHDLVAEARNEHRPSSNTRELIRVVNAWKYLEPRFEQLVDLVDPEALTEIHDLHHGIRYSLGYSNPPQTLPMPCPNGECGLLTLQRRIAVGHDLIICASCGYTVREENYPFLVRLTLDTLIDTA